MKIFKKTVVVAIVGILALPTFSLIYLSRVNQEGHVVKFSNQTDHDLKVEFKYTDFDAVKSGLAPSKWVSLNKESSPILMGVGNSSGRYPVSIYVDGAGKQWQVPCSGGNAYLVVSFSAENPLGKCVGTDSNLYRVLDNPSGILVEIKEELRKTIT